MGKANRGPHDAAQDSHQNLHDADLRRRACREPSACGIPAGLGPTEYSVSERNQWLGSARDASAETNFANVLGEFCGFPRVTRCAFGR